MYNLSKAYNENFFNKRKSFAWRAPFVVKSIIDVLKPTDIIDFGCGNGDLIKAFIDLNVHAYGIEGSINSIPAIQKMGLSVAQSGTLGDVLIHDLRTSIVLHKYSLAICFEVAEHIEEEYTNIFLENLIRASDKILITAAPPKQRGHYHVNCQYPEWWIDKFIDYGYKYDANIVGRIKTFWKRTGRANKAGIKLFYKNLLYFRKCIS